MEKTTYFYENAKFKLAVRILAIVIAIFEIIVAVNPFLTTNMIRATVLAAGLVMVALLKPIKLKNKFAFCAVNLFSIAAAIGIGAFAISRAGTEFLRTFAYKGASQLDVILAFVLLLAILESARRTTGWVLPLLCLLFLAYGMWGGNLPGILSHKGYSLKSLLEQIAFTEEGIYGTPLGAAASFVGLFVIFGGFLSETGAGEWFINMAYSLTGKAKSGPAMTAVVSSAFMGMMSGSGVANVVTTGAFTIPLMKSCGYKGEFAGAVEATASTGGQIMPPVMGAAAFILAEMAGVPYGSICVAAVLPAILYFLSCGAQVHFEACKLGFKGRTTEDLPPVKTTFLSGFAFIVPIAVLIWALCVQQYSASFSAIYAIASLILVSLIFMKKGKRITLTKILNALESGAKEVVPITIACATAGIIIGVMNKTGLSMKFSSLLISLSSGNLLFALILTMCCCVLLGMGLPTSAAFIVTAALGAPALISMGVDTMAAYMFVFYFASISAITPPVALAAYAAAGIAKTSPMRTGLYATRLGIAGFLVPYFFCFNTALLMKGSMFDIVLASLTSIVGIVLLAAALEGYALANIRGIERIGIAVGSLLMVAPGMLTDILGIAISVVCLIPMLMRYKHDKVNPAENIGA